MENTTENNTAVIVRHICSITLLLVFITFIIFDGFNISIGLLVLLQIVSLVLLQTKNLNYIVWDSLLGVCSFLLFIVALSTVDISSQNILTLLFVVVPLILFTINIIGTSRIVSRELHHEEKLNAFTRYFLGHADGKNDLENFALANNLDLKGRYGNGLFEAYGLYGDYKINLKVNSEISSEYTPSVHLYSIQLQNKPRIQCLISKSRSKLTDHSLSSNAWFKTNNYQLTQGIYNPVKLYNYWVYCNPVHLEDVSNYCKNNEFLDKMLATMDTLEILENTITSATYRLGILGFVRKFSAENIKAVINLQIEIAKALTVNL